MNFINEIPDNVIVITPTLVKKKLLRYIDDNNILKDIKFLSFNDLKKGLMFDYNNQTISFIMHYDRVSYDTAIEYLNAMYYIEDTNYNNDKLDKLVTIKNELIKNNLLIIDSYFTKLLRNKKHFYIYGYPIIDKYNQYLLALLEKYGEVSIINNQCDYHHEVYEFNTINDEIINLAERVADLINQGIPLNKIFIANYNEEYYFTIKRIFDAYQIPLYLKSTTSLYDTEIGKYALSHLNKDLDKLLLKVKTHFIDNDTNNKAINALNNLLNTYAWCNDITQEIDLLKSEMKHSIINNNHYQTEISTTSITNNIFNDDEYVFLIGFNLNSMPKVKADTDYITDNIKTTLMSSSVEENTFNKELLLTSIKNIKNLYISYKLSSLTTPNYYPSILIDNNYLVKKEGIINISKYSNLINKMDYASKIDNKIKYNVEDEKLAIYANNYQIPYQTYSNQYNPIETTKLKDKLEKKGFSYSNLGVYYKCPFRFYLSYFFNLDKYEQTLDAFIGSLFHKVLEDCVNHPDKDIDKCFDDFIIENDKKYDITDWKRRVFSNKDYFFVEKLREEVHFLVDNIREQYTHSSHDKDNEWHEKELKFSTNELNIKTGLNTFIHGYVDKVIFNGNDLMVIDYKTGTSDKIIPDLFKFGLNIQLPIYLYLLKNFDQKFNIVGLYLQHILKGFIYTDTKKEPDEIRKNNIKLDGLTLDNDSKIISFDDNYPNNSMIQGIPRSKARLVTQEYYDNLYNEIKGILENVINKAENGDFKIESIMINGKHSGCEYCKYHDICFKTGENINYINDESIKEGSDPDEQSN